MSMNPETLRKEKENHPKRKDNRAEKGKETDFFQQLSGSQALWEAFGESGETPRTSQTPLRDPNLSEKGNSSESLWEGFVLTLPERQELLANSFGPYCM